MAMSDLSDREAKRILAAAMISIGRSKDPEATLRRNEAHIRQALSQLKGKQNMDGFLRACGLAPEEPKHPLVSLHALPQAAAEHFRSIAANELGLTDSLDIADVFGSDTEGYDFTYATSQGRRTAFAMPYAGSWFFAPGPVGADELDAATRGFLRHYNLLIGMGLQRRGMQDNEIRQTGDRIRPTRALWPHETQPEDLIERFPLVLCMLNPITSGNFSTRRFFCGFDPVSGDTEGYDYED